MLHANHRRFRGILPAVFLGMGLLLPSASGRAQTAAGQSAPQNSVFQQLDKDGLDAYDRGDYVTAEQRFTEGLKRAQAQNDPLWIGSFLARRGKLFVWTGRLEQGLQDALEALRIEQTRGGKDRARLARRYKGVSSAYYALGKVDEALNYESRALQICQADNDREGMAGCYHSLGALYHYIGQLDKAMDFYLLAQKLYVETGDQEDYATILANIGLVYANMSQYDKAEATLSRGLALSQVQMMMKPSSGAKHMVVWAHLGMGLISLFQDQDVKGLEHFQQALTLSEKPPVDVRLVAHSAGGVAFAQWKNRQYDAAVVNARRALDLYEGWGDKKVIAMASGILGLAYEGQGNLESAEKAFTHALENFGAFGEQVSDASQLGALQEVLPHPFGVYARIALHRGLPEAAFLRSEQGRAQGLAQQVALNQAGLQTRLTPTDAAELKKRQDELTVASSLLRDTQTRELPADAAGRERLSREMQAAKVRYDEANRQFLLQRDTLLARYTDYRRLLPSKPVSFATLRELAHRHPDTLYLEWLIVDTKTSLLFALSDRGGLQIFPLSVGDQALRRKIKAWRDLITDPLADAKAEETQARALYADLFGPLEKAGLLPAASNGSREGNDSAIPPQAFQRIVLVGDGSINAVPFAALTDSSGKRLIERYALASSVSLSLLTWPDKSARPSAQMLCAADPIEQGSVPVRIASRGGFTPLPSARHEGRSVVRLFPGSVALIGRQARESEIKKQMEKYALLHFATHGVLDSLSGLRSGLVFAPEPRGSMEDGVLEAREIVAMRLSARMAVLSACETGQGQQSGGEGMLGLAWAFRAAGCPSIVASQWNVQDEATSQLMVAFYRALKAGKSKDDALRQAMLAVKRTEGHASPFYWAAFQVMGDTSPLPASLCK